MPYIDKTRREAFAKKVLSICNSGDLNYLITQLCQEYLELQGEKYHTYNEIIGALECAKQELYRRKIAPYEDKKIKENGDVYL
jgi:hypothetical protein